jgi:2-polyprenyl-3-methyl-5-hydroxy-6-metoxy-1,4-benzoquinol methylase
MYRAMLLDDLLIDPHSRQPLRLDWDQRQIEHLDRDRFSGRLEDNLPIILPRQLAADLQQTETHQRVDSQFDYLDHYQRDAEVFDYFIEFESPITRDESRRLHETIIHHVPASARLILDVGCGNGWLSQALVNAQRQVISMDISLRNPQKALANLPHPNHAGLVADVFNLPLADASVDCIVASEIIEHVPSPVQFVAQLMRPLKPGGKLIITTPYNEKLVYHLCIHCNRPTPEHAHIHSFSEANVSQLIPASVKQWRHETFANKYASRLRLYLLIKGWPFRWWQSADRLANRLMKPPTRLMIELTKEG